MIFLLASCGVPGKTPSEDLLQGCESSGSALHRVLDRGVLRVGYVVYPPTVIQDSASGDPTGFFIEAIGFIAEQMGVETVFLEAEWRTVLLGLRQGEYDVSVAAMFRTIPRAINVAFTRPIIFVGDGAIVRREDTRFEQLNDLNDFDSPGVTIAVVEGTSSHDFARRRFPRATLEVLATSDMRRPLEEVLAGRVDVGIADAPSTVRFAAEHPEVVDLFEGRPFEVTSVGWAVCQGDFRWLGFLNTALEYLESTGRMQDWQARYD